MNFRGNLVKREQRLTFRLELTQLTSQPSVVAKGGVEFFINFLWKTQRSQNAKSDLFDLTV